MAGDKKKGRKRENFPDPGGQTKLSIPERPFYTHKIAVALSSNPTKMSKYTDASKRVEYQINRHPSMKLKYMLFMLKLRDDFKKALSGVFTDTAMFRATNINKYFNINEHPNFKLIDSQVAYGRKKMTDGDRINIEVLLRDSLALIEAHLTDIIVSIQLTMCPDYKELLKDVSD